MAASRAMRRGCGSATATAATRPATGRRPRRPNSKERWYFCETHAAEYNQNWNYFAGLDAAEAAAREAEESAEASAFRQAPHWQWGGPGDGSRSRDEMRALDALELDSDADFGKVKAAYRRLAKENHPDLRQGDAGRGQALPAGPGGLRRASPGRGAARSQAAALGRRS